MTRHAILGALFFLGLVIGGLVLTRQGRGSGEAPDWRVRVSCWLVGVLTVVLWVGITQRQFWPFSSWPLVAGLVPERVTQPHLVAVDENGQEQEVDARAWEPLSFDELTSWSDSVLPRLSREDQRQVLSYLVGHIERARQRALKGEAIGTYGRILGPAHAPLFLLHPRRWTNPADVPSTPLVGIRLYRESWTVGTRADGTGRVERRLVLAYPDST